MSLPSLWEGMADRNETPAAVTSGSGKSKSFFIPLQTVSHWSFVNRVQRMRSKASFLQTAEAGDAMISSQADFEMADMSLPAAECCRACRRAPAWRRPSLERRSAWICANIASIFQFSCFLRLRIGGMCRGFDQSGIRTRVCLSIFMCFFVFRRWRLERKIWNGH